MLVAALEAEVDAYIAAPADERDAAPVPPDINRCSPAVNGQPVHPLAPVLCVYLQGS